MEAKAGNRCCSFFIETALMTRKRSNTDQSWTRCVLQTAESWASICLCFNSTLEDEILSEFSAIFFATREAFFDVFGRSGGSKSLCDSKLASKLCDQNVFSIVPNDLLGWFGCSSRSLTDELHQIRMLCGRPSIAH